MFFLSIIWCFSIQKSAINIVVILRRKFSLKSDWGKCYKIIINFNIWNVKWQSGRKLRMCNVQCERCEQSVRKTNANANSESMKLYSSTQLQLHSPIFIISQKLIITNGNKVNRFEFRCERMPQRIRTRRFFFDTLIVSQV